MSQALELLQKMKSPEERFENWKDTLYGIFQTETVLLNLVKDNIPKNILPNLKEKYTELEFQELFKYIKPVEDEIDRLKKLATQCEKDRKVYTEVLGKVCERMMIPEKEFKSFVKDLTDGILIVKRIKSEYDERKRCRERELSDFRMNCQKKFNTDYSNQEQNIFKEISKNYKIALEAIKVDELERFCDCLRDTCITNFTKRISFDKYSDEEKQAINDDIFFNWDSESLEAKVIECISETFQTFEYDINKKEEAIKIQEQKDEAKVEEAESNLNMDNQMAELEYHAAPTNVLFEEKTKNLQKFYTIDMEHNETNMVLIQRCYYANKAKVGKFGKSDLWDMNVNDMAKMICKIKEKDESFEAMGIIFKEDTKLGR